MTTSVALSPVAILQFFDNAGKLCVGGSLLTQSGGVNYATYSEPTGTTALPNPIPLNSRGEVSTAAGASSELFLQTGVSYTFTLKDANGNQLWSIGNITSGGSGNVAVSFPTASGSANAQIVTNPVPISLGIGTIQWFLPVAANTGATTINVDNSGAKNVFFLTKALVGGELQIGVPAQIIYDGTQWNLTGSAKGPATDFYLATGTNAYSVASVNMAQGGGASGLRIKLVFNNTSTAASPTISINGSTPQIIYYNDGVTPLVAGALLGSSLVVYDLINTPNGITICTNPSRVTGSFTGQLTGVVSGGSGTINYSIGIDGKSVDAWLTASITATSNSTLTTITGIPASIAPATSKMLPMKWDDNGAVGTTLGNILTGISTTWNLFTNLASSGPTWTASGVKGIVSTNFAWHWTLD